MNVYTHVAMADLHDDVEALPSLPGSSGKAQATVRARQAEAATATAEASADLAGLVSAWDKLPAKVRSAIAVLAGA